MNQGRAARALMLALGALAAAALLFALYLNIRSAWPPSEEALPPRPVSARAVPQPADDAASSRLNINEATAAQLTQLPGIGERIAAAIVTKREALGGFLCPEELLLVPGIGPKRLDAISGLICVNAAE